MSDLNIASIQTKQVWEDVDANLKHFEKKLETLKKVDIVLLPEMFQTGFSMNTDHAEEFNSSKSIEWLKRQAKKIESAIYTSLMIKEGDQFYNRGCFVEPGGKIHFYDKMKCFGMAGEDKVITAGKKNVIVEYLGWKIQLNICYDLRFPEIMRNSSNANENYDVLLLVANWPEKRIEHWKQLLLARAIENQSFVIGLNRIGQDQKGHAYNGQSRIVDPQGKDMALVSDQDFIQKARLVKAEMQMTRTHLPFLRDARS